MNTCPHFSRLARRGFTLVELLVVIVIVIVLVALSFAVIGTVRGKAQAANAINSLRQVGMAQVSYASENHGAINTMLDKGHPLEGNGENVVRNSFWGRMQPFLFTGATSENQSEYKSQIIAGINVLFNTPNANKMSGTPFADAPIYEETDTGVPYPVGFNDNLRALPDSPRVKVVSMDDPSRIIYCAYGRNFILPSHGQQYRTLATSNSAGFFFLDDRKAIICFLDGHVEAIVAPIDERLFGDPPPAP